MTSFLDGNIWSVYHNEFNPSWFYVHKIYYYNSLNTDPNTLEPEFIQIPEFVIENLSLLNTIDLKIVNEYSVPLIKKYDSIKWKIDLEIYNETINNMQ